MVRDPQIGRSTGWIGITSRTEMMRLRLKRGDDTRRGNEYERPTRGAKRAERKEKKPTKTQRRDKRCIKRLEQLREQNRTREKRTREYRPVSTNELKSLCQQVDSKLTRARQCTKLPAVAFESRVYVRVHGIRNEERKEFIIPKYTDADSTARARLQACHILYILRVE